jgi:hypothetical protein
MSAAELRATLGTLEESWRGDEYNLLSQNCNHFSAALVAALGLRMPVRTPVHTLCRRRVSLI